jgi:(p)ppGpp synthase/HD superfamily hydrolase
MDIVERARVFATAAHAAVGQLRKYTGEPYIVHPIEVCNIVATVSHTPQMLAAGLLHDVVEDTQINNEVIYDQFGFEVARMVWWLTDVSKPEDGNREHRKRLDRQHIAGAPAEVQTVKLADIISNLQSIRAHDAEFARIYFQEKHLMVEQCLQMGNPVLLQQARGIINDYFQSTAS